MKAAILEQRETCLCLLGDCQEERQEAGVALQDGCWGLQLETWPGESCYVPTWWVTCFLGIQIGDRAWRSPGWWVGAVPVAPRECGEPPGPAAPPGSFPHGFGYPEAGPWAQSTRCRELGALFSLLPTAAAAEGCWPGLVPRDVPTCSTPGRVTCVCSTCWKCLVDSQVWGKAQGASSR